MGWGAWTSRSIHHEVQTKPRGSLGKKAKKKRENARRAGLKDCGRQENAGWLLSTDPSRGIREICGRGVGPTRVEQGTITVLRRRFDTGMNQRHLHKRSSRATCASRTTSYLEGMEGKPLYQWRASEYAIDDGFERGESLVRQTPPYSATEWATEVASWCHTPQRGRLPQPPTSIGPGSALRTRRLNNVPRCTLQVTPPCAVPTPNCDTSQPARAADET
jgi:hypothetical protein